MPSEEALVRAKKVCFNFATINFCNECKEIAKEHGIKWHGELIRLTAKSLDEWKQKVRDEAIEEIASLCHDMPVRLNPMDVEIRVRKLKESKC